MLKKQSKTSEQLQKVFSITKNSDVPSQIKAGDLKKASLNTGAKLAKSSSTASKVVKKSDKPVKWVKSETKKAQEAVIRSKLTHPQNERKGDPCI